MSEKLIKTIKEIQLNGDQITAIKGSCKASDLQRSHNTLEDLGIVRLF